MRRSSRRSFGDNSSHINILNSSESCEKKYFINFRNKGELLPWSQKFSNSLGRVITKMQELWEKENNFRHPTELVSLEN